MGENAGGTQAFPGTYPRKRRLGAKSDNPPPEPPQCREGMPPPGGNGYLAFLSTLSISINYEQCTGIGRAPSGGAGAPGHWLATLAPLLRETPTPSRRGAALPRPLRQRASVGAGYTLGNTRSLFRPPRPRRLGALAAGTGETDGLTGPAAAR